MEYYMMDVGSVFPNLKNRIKIVRNVVEVPNFNDYLLIADQRFLVALK